MRLALAVPALLASFGALPSARGEKVARLDPFALEGSELVPPKRAASRPGEIDSNQWLVSGHLGLGNFRVVGLQVDYDAIDWLSLIAGVGGGDRPEASGGARVKAHRGHVGAGFDASVSAEPDLRPAPVPRLDLDVWGSVNAQAWMHLDPAWKLHAFIGAAEALNKDAPQLGAPSHRLVGGFSLGREL